MSTLVHELTHIRQLVEGRLVPELMYNEVNEFESYIKRWYEIEAFVAQFKFRREIEKDCNLENNCIYQSYRSLGIRC